MDFYKEFEDIGKKRTVRENQELDRISPKSEVDRFRYRNTAKKSTGEYFESKEDRITLLKKLSTHPTMPIFDKRFIKENLR